MVVVAPPPHHEPEALIKEARERQRRRRLLGTAGVALLAGLALGIYAGLAGFSHPPSAARTAAGGPPRCRSTQLSASFGTGGAAGLALGGLVLGDSASRPCSLPVGRPSVHFIFRGKPLPVQERSWARSEQFGARADHVLRPGEKAFFEIGWLGSCPNPAAAPESRHATLLVRFPGGLRLAVPDTPPDRFVSLPGCGEPVHPTPWIAVSRLLRVG